MIVILTECALPLTSGRRVAPACGVAEGAGSVGVLDLRHTDGLDVVREGHLLGQLQHGQVAALVVPPEVREQCDVPYLAGHGPPSSGRLFYVVRPQ